MAGGMSGYTLNTSLGRVADTAYWFSLLTDFHLSFIAVKKIYIGFLSFKSPSASLIVFLGYPIVGDRNTLLPSLSRE